MRLTEISLEQEFWSYSEFKLNKDWVSTSLGFLGKMEIRGAVCNLGVQSPQWTHGALRSRCPEDEEHPGLHRKLTTSPLKPRDRSAHPRLFA